MSWITKQIRVYATKDRSLFESKQYLVRDTYLFGVRVWTSVLDVEDVPAHALIEKATLGATYWRSKFYEQIGEQEERNAR